MTAPSVICTRLLSISAVTAIVGSRVYALVFAQKPELAAIRVQQISEFESLHLRGTESRTVSRMQVDCAATTKAAAEALEAAVHGDGLGATASGLNGWRGLVSTIEVDVIVPSGRRERYDADELKQYVISRDYMLHWRPT